MISFFKQETKFDFLGIKNYTLGLSGVLTLGAVAAFFLMGGLNQGVDFSGGTVVQVQFEQKPDLSKVRDVLDKAGLGSFSLQSFGEENANEVLVSMSQSEEVRISQAGEEEGQKTLARQVEEALTAAFTGVSIRRVETVGPKVGDELKKDAVMAILISIILILLYVWFRFEWRYSVGAVAALAHDVVLVVGLFVVTQKEMTLTVVAAILTVAGYSINDTIVILDRFRDNIPRHPKMAFKDVLNVSINQTLSRTVLTSGTTLLVVVAMFFLGGEILHDFSLALLVGIGWGTYSSIFIATPLLYILHERFPPYPKG